MNTLAIEDVCECHYVIGHSHLFYRIQGIEIISAWLYEIRENNASNTGLME